MREPSLRAPRNSSPTSAGVTAPDVPEGVERELLEAMRRRIAEGVARDRLMEVVNAVRAETGCEPDRAHAPLPRPHPGLAERRRRPR